MKKTKLLTSIAALALVVGLGACETGDININIDGGVNIGGDSSKDTSEDGTSEDSTDNESTLTDTTTEGGTTGEGTSEGDTTSESTSETNPEGNEGNGSVADMLGAIADGESFTLETYYYELVTEDYETLEDAQAATTYAYYTEADVVITYTTDAIVMEYYLFGQLYDVEGYLNDYDDQAYQADLVLIFYLDENGALYNTWYGWYGTWQEIFDSPLQLTGFADAFTAGDVSTGNNGSQINYDIDFTMSGLAEALINDMFIAENWFAGEGVVSGPDHILELLEDESASDYYTYASTYYVDYDKWETEFQTADMIYVESQVSFVPGTGITTTTSYWVERDYMSATISDVGSTVIDPEWAQYLVLS